MPRSILKRTKKRTPGKRSKRRVKIGGRVRGKKPKRPYKVDKAARLRRRHRRRHPKSKVHGHHKRMRRESETMNYLLHQLLKTASSTEADPYNYDPRHHSKDPEYRYADKITQEFKRGVPAPDTHFWRPQGNAMPPYRGNYPNWAPEWAHPFHDEPAPARRGPLGMLRG